MMTRHVLSALVFLCLLACSRVREPASVQHQALEECPCACEGGTGGSSGSAGNAGSGAASGAGTAGTGGASCLTDTITFSVLRAGLLEGNSAGWWEQARDVAFDAVGAMFVVGGTPSADFPATVGAYDTTRDSGGSTAGWNGPLDWFVTKFSASGALVWSTFVGGPNYDLPYAVEVDATGVYVAGRCGDGFPITTGAAFAGDSRAGLYGQQDGCVTKLTLDGSALLWSRYLGESTDAVVRDIAVDALGQVHVVHTNVWGSMGALVTADAAQSTRQGLTDAYYGRLSADGTTVQYGTYLGGTDSGYTDANPSVRIGPNGSAYVLASEPGTGAPTTVGAYQIASAGGFDALLARFDGNALTWATYVGGSGNEKIDTHSHAVLPSGETVLAVLTTSSNFPGGSTNLGNSDVGVAIISANGASLVAGTTIGGNGKDAPEGVSVDACGNVYISGATASTNLPVTPGALVTTSPGTLRGLEIVLSPDLQVRRYVSYDGIRAEYGNRASALTPDGSWAIVGAVWQTSPFPSVGGYDSALDGTHGTFFRVLQ